MMFVHVPLTSCARSDEFVSWIVAHTHDGSLTEYWTVAEIGFCAVLPNAVRRA
jgi:hypothetical protein